MAFPDTPAPLAVELQLGGTWTDVTSYVRIEDKIKLRRGRSGEAQNVDPARCELTLDNRDGRFSLRNPTSPYYGQLTRNTPLRVTVSGLDNVSLQTTPPTSSRATAPHTAAQNTGAGGDVDLRIDLVPYDQYARAQDLIGKWDVSTGQASYLMWTDGEGYLWLSWSTTGTGAGQLDVRSTVQVPRDNFRRFSVRAYLDVNDGAGHSTVTFYYADALAGPWRQLGDVIVRSSTTSVFSSTAQLSIARMTSSGTQMSMTGRVYGAQVRVGTNAATLAASPDFTTATAGAASLTDAQGNVWSPSATASFSSANVRFVGEVSQWPVEWEQSGREVTARIVASGLLRRLQANVPPLRSTLRRSIPALSTLRAYWPGEDAQAATSLAYGLPDPLGQYAASITNTPSLSSFSGFLASDDLPTYSQGSYSRGRVPSYTASGFAQLRFLLAVPSSSPPAAGTDLAVLTCSTTVWRVRYNGAGALALYATESGNPTAIVNVAPMTFDAAPLDGRLMWVSLELTQNGANIDWRLQALQVGRSTGTFFTGTGPGATIGVAQAVQVGAPGTNSQVAIGHVTVESSITSLFALYSQLNAYTGELSTARAARLAAEEGYALYRQGPTPSTAMGPQAIDSLLTLLRQCADSDLGILYEMRGVNGLAFHPRSTMYARDSAVVLSYPAGHVTDLEPVDDDQGLVNDVVLTREFGSSYEAALTSGALSTAAPPNGVGKYQQATTVSLGSDSQLREQANYRLALGTIDAPRYPTIGVGLHRPAFVGSTAGRELTRAVLDVDLGDVVQVDGLPGFYAPYTTYQRVEGVTETISEGGRRYDVQWNTSPGELWRGTGVWNDPSGRTRYDTNASALAAAATSSATTLTVATTDGSPWTTTPAHWPFAIMVGGELMTVTAVAGTSTPQTFTVVRSVNGVVKAQQLGTPVHVYTPAYYGF